MELRSSINRIHSHYLLDQACSPVARFRLLSKGVNDNTRLLDSERVAGDNACLACGNCIDSCPVVRNNRGRVFIQNQRTSMQLEHIVQDECRRCYRCVNACPQVAKELKEYTLGYRRVEKIVHMLAALTIVALAGSGITYSHYGEVLGSFEGGLLKYGHRLLGIISVIIPFLYYRFDVCHFRRTLKNIFSWGKQDRVWFRDLYAHVAKGERARHIERHEFNPAQKVWYLFILAVFPILYLSGWSSIVLGTMGGEMALIRSKMVHLVFALSFDLMLFSHVYIKYGREWIKNIVELCRNYQQTKGFVFKG